MVVMSLSIFEPSPLPQCVALVPACIAQPLRVRRDSFKQNCFTRLGQFVVLPRCEKNAKGVQLKEAISYLWYDDAFFWKMTLPSPLLSAEVLRTLRNAQRGLSAYL